MPAPPPTVATTSLPPPPSPPPPTSYNSLIRSYARSSIPSLKLEALCLYHALLLDPSSPPPDRYTFPFVLKSCSYFSLLSKGSQLHSHVIKLGLAYDTYVANSLVHFYSSCGQLACAHKVFDKIAKKSRVSWNVIIDACVANGEYQEALLFFRDMQMGKFTPDIFTFQSVIDACTGIGSLSLGMWTYRLMLRSTDREMLLSNALVNNSLIDLYSKCGSIDLATRVFHLLPCSKKILTS